MVHNRRPSDAPADPTCLSRRGQPRVDVLQGVQATSGTGRAGPGHVQIFAWLGIIR
jgi:hypothetical protein